MKAKPFTTEQKHYINQGEVLSEQLTSEVFAGLGLTAKSVEVKRHHYITSGPGAGKTYTVNNAIELHDLKVVRIQGAASMNAIVIQLAVAVYLKPKGDILVWVDDCDSIFLDKECLNVMKGALDEGRNVLTWNKNLTNQINIYMNSDAPNDKLKGEALRSFQPTGSVGVEVPTDRVRFIITSNKRLVAPSKANLNRVIQVNEAAIRDRVNYREYELDDKRSWGWMAHNVISAKTLGPNLKLTADQKRLLLDWMWHNWKWLSATSMRAVQELGAHMVNHPDDYPDRWEAHLLRRNEE
jgi:hypothetical protein